MRVRSSILCLLTVFVIGQVTSTAQTPQFQNQDIGSVGLTGSTSQSNGTWTVTASGADIWGAADAFRFAYVQQSGDFQIIARVSSVQPTDPWAKAGVMVR